MLPRALIACLLLLALSCSGGGGGGASSGGAAGGGAAAPGGPPAAVPGTSVLMDYAPGGAFYAAPFPDEAHRAPGGRIDLARWPNRYTNLFVDALATIAERDMDGFGLTSGIFFALTGPVDARALPTLDESVARGSPVFLVGVDPASPDHLRRYPVHVAFHADGGPSGAPNMLSLVPLQGVALREGTLYAAVVLRALPDGAGAPLGAPLAMAELAAGVQPAGMSFDAFREHQTALASLRQDGIDPRAIAGIAVFRTGRPTAGLERFRQAALAQPAPRPTGPLVLDEVFSDYCVVKTTIRMPIYQAGAPPFLTGGGEWQVDATGAPIPQGTEEANLYVTVPRRAMPAAGFPACVVIRTGLGQGLRPIADRTTFPGGPPGGGPAQELARAGFVGVQVDGPHGGRRNVTGADEQLLMFNFANPLAMRDNIRQAALELIVLAEVLPALSIDPAQCPGTTTPAGAPIAIDPAKVALFGHSMGATIAPLALAGAPRYRAGILSGAGAGWIENVLWKQKPAPILPIAEAILGYGALGRALHRHDPVLSLLQWAGEPADPQVYARHVTAEPRLGDPRHVLMLQGIVDRYILPPIANGASLALGLDLAGPALDARLPPDPTYWPTLPEVLHFAGGRAHPLPIGGNRVGPGGAPYTAVVVQHPEDGIQDGHEVVFQRDEPKAQVRAFLESFARGGAPVVP